MNFSVKRLALYFIPLFLISCSSFKLPPKKYDHEYKYVDPRVMHLVKRIEGYAGYRMPFLKIQIKDISGDSPKAGGVCHMYTRQITLPSKRWFFFSDEKQESILLHEIGHCVFGRKHLNNPDPKRCPYSLMHKSGASDECFLEHKLHYIRELFNNV